MARDPKSSLVVFFLIAVVAVAVFGGIVYWSLPVILNQKVEQVPIRSKDPVPKSKVFSPPVAAADEGSNEAEGVTPPISEIVANVGGSVVKITTLQNRTRYDFFYGETQEQVKGEGSGVIVDQQGYILTNNHVVEGADEIIVLLANRQDQAKELRGEVLGRDPLTDLAVVKVEGADLPVAKLGDSDRLKVGEPAIAIGNPYGFANTVTVGVISALNRDLPIREGTELLDLVQTDAAINPGNSGGALFNLRGEVVGINTAILQGAQGLGFAIPINIAREISRQLIEKGEVTRPWIGIYGRSVVLKTEGEQQLPATGGVMVYQVIEGGPADQAGLREGDIIIGLDKTEITSMEGLLRELRRYEIGEAIGVRILRNEKEQTVELELAARPEESYRR